MNTISKVCLQLILLDNKLKGGNGWKSFIGLVKRRKDLSDKAYLNILKAINRRWERVEPSIKRGNKTARDLGIGAGTEPDNKIVGVLGEAKRGDKQVRDSRQDDKEAKDSS